MAGVRFASALLIATLLVIAGCSGDKTGTFALRTPAGKASARATASPKVPAPRGRLSPPAPARMFAGTNSGVGDLLHYCKGSSCEDLAARSVTYVVEKAGQITDFAIGPAPVDAYAEVRTRASAQPSTVPLNAGTLMVFNHGLGPGRYLIDLVVRWPSSEARWRFGLKIAS